MRDGGAGSSAKHTPRALVPQDLLNISIITDARISPDGSHVAYVVKSAHLDCNEYSSVVCVVETGGDDPRTSRQMTTGGYREAAPRWSPDGSRLAFISDRSGQPQLYVVARQGGEARQITTFSRGVSAPEWSPDGTQIAFQSSEGSGIDDDVRNHPDGVIRRINRLRYRVNGSELLDDRFQHIWIVDVASGDTRQLTWGDRHDAHPTWSPDGRTLAFVSSHYVESDYSRYGRALLYMIATTSSDHPISPICVSEDINVAMAPSWSPDGKWIAYSGQRHDAPSGANSDFFVSPTDGGNPARSLTGAFDRSPGVIPISDTWRPQDDRSMFWSPDGRHVYFTACDRGRVGLYSTGLDGNVCLLAGGDRTLAFVSSSADGTRLAYVTSDFTNPCDIYARHVDEPGERRLTHLNVGPLDQVEMQQPEVMPFASFDGDFEIDAWLMRPAGYEAGRDYPLVQIIHGGPHSAFGHMYFFDMQLWAHQGWNVLFVNPRGSQGYGETFSTCNNGDWGGGDWRDQEMALDLAIERGGVDSQRLAVTGLSYGGYMTNWIIGHSTRYRVAVSENGVSNLVSHFTTADFSWHWMEKEMGRGVWENLDYYMERSPISYVPRIQTPLLLLQGESDFQCRIEQGEQLYTALRLRGVDCEMVRFPGEGHLMQFNGKPRSRLQRREHTLRWFHQYL